LYREGRSGRRFGALPASAGLSKTPGEFGFRRAHDGLPPTGFRSPPVPRGFPDSGRLRHPTWMHDGAEVA